MGKPKMAGPRGATAVAERSPQVGNASDLLTRLDLSDLRPGTVVQVSFEDSTVISIAITNLTLEVPALRRRETTVNGVVVMSTNSEYYFETPLSSTYVGQFVIVGESYYVGINNQPGVVREIRVL